MLNSQCKEKSRLTVSRTRTLYCYFKLYVWPRDRHSAGLLAVAFLFVLHPLLLFLPFGCHRCPDCCCNIPVFFFPAGQGRLPWSNSKDHGAAALLQSHLCGASSGDIPDLVLPPAEKPKPAPPLQSTAARQHSPLDSQVPCVGITIQARRNRGELGETVPWMQGAPVSPVHFQTCGIILGGHRNSLRHGWA